MDWLRQQLVINKYCNQLKCGKEVKERVLVKKGKIIDYNSQRIYGTKYVFKFDGKTKIVYLLNDCIPINFLFYGVPTEYIDQILAQLLDVSIKLIKYQNDEKKRLDNFIYCVDYDPEMTNDVYGAIDQNIKRILKPMPPNMQYQREKK